MGVPAIHPDEHLAEELKELGMSAAELARRLDVPTNRVTEILNGRRAAVLPRSELRRTTGCGGGFASAPVRRWAEGNDLSLIEEGDDPTGKAFERNGKRSYHSTKQPLPPEVREWLKTLPLKRVGHSISR